MLRAPNCWRPSTSAIIVGHKSALFFSKFYLKSGNSSCARLDGEVEVALSLGVVNGHIGTLRGTPRSSCPQPEPNATELPSCAPISARAPQRRRRRRWWRGEEGARRPGPESQLLRHALWNVLRTSCCASFTCLSFMCHLRAGVRGCSRPGCRAPKHTFFPHK